MVPLHQRFLTDARIGSWPPKGALDIGDKRCHAGNSVGAKLERNTSPAETARRGLFSSG